MFKTLKTAWGIPEIRKKILFTLFIIVIFRLGSVIVVPFLDTNAVAQWMDANAKNTGNFLEYLNILSGGALATVAVGSAAAIGSGVGAAVPTLQSTGINGGIAGLDPDITCKIR